MQNWTVPYLLKYLVSWTDDRTLVVPSTVSSLQLWLDATDTTTIDRDVNNKVDRWDDKSGNGNNLLQGTGTSQPLYNPLGMNNRPGLIFDGVDDSIARNITDYSVANGVTMFLVYKSTLTTQPDLASVFANAVGNTSGTFQACFSTTVNNKLAVGANYDDATLFNVAIENTLSNVSPTIASFYLGGNKNTVTYQNGKNVSDTPLASAFSCTFNGYRVGANRANNVFLTGVVSEVILYLDRIDSLKRQGIERYLSKKYTIPLKH